MKQSQKRSSKRPARVKSFPVVGIGASAGRLEATTQLLKQLPGDTGMAFVLVQHLDPTQESAPTSLLIRMRAMPPTEARNNLSLEPNHLYVSQPNKTTDNKIDGAVVVLVDIDHPKGGSPPQNLMNSMLLYP